MADPGSGTAKAFCEIYADIKNFKENITKQLNAFTEQQEAETQAISNRIQDLESEAVNVDKWIQNQSPVINNLVKLVSWCNDRLCKLEAEQVDSQKIKHAQVSSRRSQSYTRLIKIS